MNKYLVPTLGCLAAGIAVLAPELVFAQTSSEAGGAILTDQNEDEIVESVSGIDLKDGIRTVINWILGFLGLLVTIMLIYGGFLYITSAGDDEQTGKAKNIILYSIIGIVLIAFSYAITAFVIGTFVDESQVAAETGA